MRVRRLIGNWNNLLAVLTAAFVVTCVVNYDASAQGRTTNDSVFTDEQATRGEDAYQQECAQCHLDDLLGDGIAPALIGARSAFDGLNCPSQTCWLRFEPRCPKGHQPV